MFEAATKRESKWRIFWPDVSDLHGAQDAINLGYWAMFIMAIINGVMLALRLVPVGVAFDVALMVLLGLGIRFRFRAAAVLAFLYVFATFAINMSRGIPPIGVLSWVIFAGSLNALRGTFAYKRLKLGASYDPLRNEPDDTPLS